MSSSGCPSRAVVPGRAPVSLPLSHTHSHTYPCSRDDFYPHRPNYFTGLLFLEGITKVNKFRPRDAADWETGAVWPGSPASPSPVRRHAGHRLRAPIVLSAPLGRVLAVQVPPAAQSRLSERVHLVHVNLSWKRPCCPPHHCFPSREFISTPESSEKQFLKKVIFLKNQTFVKVVKVFLSVKFDYFNLFHLYMKKIFPQIKMVFLYRSLTASFGHSEKM